METYKRRKLFDDDDEDEDQSTGYTPQALEPVKPTPKAAPQKQAEPQIEAKVSVSGSRGGRKLFDDDDEDEGATSYSYTPSQTATEPETTTASQIKSQVSEPSEDLYKTASDKPAATSTAKPKKMFDDEDDDYQPSYQPAEEKTREPSPPKAVLKLQSSYMNDIKQEPVKSQVASERGNLFDDSPYQIDDNANSKPSLKQVERPAATEKSKAAPSQPKVVSEEDKKAKQEAEKLKKMILEDLSSMKEVNLDEPVKEQEDPKVKQFSVSNPVKIGGHMKYTVTGIQTSIFMNNKQILFLNRC